MWSIRTEIRLAIVTLLVVQTLISFGAIALLTRVTATLERVLDEHVAAIASIEEMRSSLTAIRLEGPNPNAKARFDQAFGQVQVRRIDDKIPPAVAVVARWQAVALAGDPSALTVTARALAELTDAHHTAMIDEEKAASRLGEAGAWAAVLLATVGFAFSVLIIHRLTQQLLAPLHELHATVLAYRAGDRYRRCRSAGAPSEFQAAAETFNALLDATLLAPTLVPQGPDVERLALLHLLDARPEPMLVVDREGQITAANSLGMQRLAEDADGQLRHAAEVVARAGAEELDPAVTATPLGQTGWLLQVGEPR